VEAFSKQQVDLMILMQEMTNEAHGRRLKEREHESKQAMMEGIWEMLKVAVPIGINRLAGKPVYPEDDKTTLLLGAFLENLTPEQQEYFKSNLSPAQLAVLAEILQGYEEKKDRLINPGKKSKHLLAKAPKSDEDDIQPLPSQQKLSERISSPASVSNDPEIRKIEDAVSSFSSRFKEVLKQPPALGEKK
jgi:hypothetical protein